MTRLSFRERTETKKVVILGVICTSYEEYYKKLRRQGELDAGCHYFIDEYGKIQQGRDLAAVAGWHYEESENSIYILVQLKDNRLTSSEKYVLRQLIAEIKNKYPNVKVENHNG